MRRVVEILSARRRTVATRSTVGKAENSSGFWIHSATIRMRTESAIDSARPKSIAIAGTGRKNKHRMRTMPTAKPMSLPPRLAGAVGIAVADMGHPQAPGHGALEERLGGQACARGKEPRDRSGGRSARRSL